MEYLTHVVLISSTFIESSSMSWLELDASVSPFKAFIWWGPLWKIVRN